jgi:hypothetical protein
MARSMEGSSSREERKKGKEQEEVATTRNIVAQLQILEKNRAQETYRYWHNNKETKEEGNNTKSLIAGNDSAERTNGEAQNKYDISTQETRMEVYQRSQNYAERKEEINHADGRTEEEDEGIEESH